MCSALRVHHVTCSGVGELFVCQQQVGSSPVLLSWGLRKQVSTVSSNEASASRGASVNTTRPQRQHEEDALLPSH